MVEKGYTLNSIWECEFYDILKTRPDLHHQPAVKARDALYGGRTEAMRLHYKMNDNETIQYCDIMSLYPFICKTFKFPVGNPTIHVAP